MVNKPSTVTKTVTYQKKYGSLTKPVRKGYVFVGWYTTKTGNTEVTSASTVTNKKAHTLYARWAKVTVEKSSIKAIKRCNNQAVVTVEKVSDAKGYEIKYSADKAFKKSKTVSTVSTTTTLKLLHKTKTYYFKVRVYKTDSTGEKVYSAWSSVKMK